MQQIRPPTGPHNPNGHTEATILRALKGLDGHRRFTFRFELLDKTNTKLRDMSEVQARASRVSVNNLADIKRTASFRVRDAAGRIDYLNDRIKPWVRLHVPPYGPQDWVEWPQGVFLLVAPARDADATGTVWRDIEAYDAGMVLAEDQIDGRFTTDGILAAQDGFMRNVTGGWGTADSGQAWLLTTTTDTTRTVTASGDGYATVTLTGTNNNIRIQTIDQRFRDGQVYTRLAVSQTATGSAMLPAIVLRFVSTTVYYRMRVHCNTDGTVSLSVARGATQIGDTENTNLTYTPGGWLRVKARLVDQTVYGKVWADTAPEPRGWMIEREITTDQIAEGYFGLSASTFGSNTNTNPQFRYDMFTLDGNPLGLVTGLVQHVLTSAGITQMRITPSEETLPAVREWEPGTTRLAIVNELLDAISYRSLSFDEHGVAECEPYVSPSEKAVEYTYADDHESVMLPQAQQHLDLHAVPNRWILSVSEPDQGTITVTYTNTNPASPTSTVRRGRVITEFRPEQDATSESALIEHAARAAYESSQVYEETEFSTGLMPVHSHNDVFRIRRDDLAIDAIYSGHTWELPLDATATMRHTARRTITLRSGSDPSIVVGPATITGALEAGNIATGTATITPVANTPTAFAVTGLNLQGSGRVRVQVTAATSVPGSTVKEVTIRKPSPTGFTIWLLRTNTTATTVYWLAIRGA